MFKRKKPKGAIRSTRTLDDDDGDHKVHISGPSDSKDANDPSGDQKNDPASLDTDTDNKRRNDDDEEGARLEDVLLLQRSKKRQRGMSKCPTKQRCISQSQTELMLRFSF